VCTFSVVPSAGVTETSDSNDQFTLSIMKVG
jgi:hypothetical protein